MYDIKHNEKVIWGDGVKKQKVMQKRTKGIRNPIIGEYLLRIIEIIANASGKQYIKVEEDKIPFKYRADFL